MEVVVGMGELASRGSAIILTPADDNGRVFTADNRQLLNWQEGAGSMKMASTCIILY